MEFNAILTILTFVPTIGAIALAFGGREGENDDQIRWGALGTAILTLILSVVVLFTFEKGSADLQMVDRFDWISAFNIQYFMGIDGISIWMIMLTTFISLLAIAASFPMIHDKVKQYYIFMLLLETGMLGVFLAQDLFLFYIFWEFTLIPMYFLIGIWGGKERVYAAIKFFLYTMSGSLLMLVAILYLGIQADTFAVPELVSEYANSWGGAERWLFVAFAVAFAVKVPLFPFHSWLPDAHTQAPTAGSIILAGVLLKMGTYGFMRFNVPLFPNASAYFAPSIAVLAIIGIIYGAIVSFAQRDVKKLVAYSSVSHLGFVMLGIFSLTQQGWNGAIIQGVNHGISSGALFYMVGVIYEQRHSRQIEDFGGIWIAMPVFSILSLIITLSSMGLPGLNGFVGEFTILLGSMGSEVLGPTPWIYTAFATTGVILAAVYLLWMFQRVFLGPLDKPENQALRDVNRWEMGILVAFVIFIVWIGIAPSGYFSYMETTVNQVIEMTHTAVNAVALR